MIKGNSTDYSDAVLSPMPVGIPNSVQIIGKKEQFLGLVFYFAGPKETLNPTISHFGMTRCVMSVFGDKT